MRNFARGVSVLAMVVTLVGAGCAVPVQTKPVGPDEVYTDLKQDVLLDGEPSVAARLALERAGLADAWNDDPATAIAALHEMATQSDTRERLFGLAELCIYQGRRMTNQRWYLGAAVYAYLYLFGQADAPPPGPFDPRFRLAADLYSRGVAEAFRDPKTHEFVPRAGRFELPVGEIEITVPSGEVRIGDGKFDQFMSADEFAVEGVRARVRTAGIGAPLIARRRHSEALSAIDSQAGYMPPRISLPMTAVLAVDGQIADILPGRTRATVDLYSPLLAHTVTIRGAETPLCVDSTTPLAYGLGTSPLWSFALHAFFSGGDEPIRNGILFMAPYQRGKIPIVLVHGTASSPATWVELVNELMADRVISDRYQVWLFIYSTGGPVLVSAASLRNCLAATFKAVDPDGTDAALNRTVVIGHSQGGLLTQLMATASGNRFWSNISDEPFDKFEMTPEERELFRNACFFEPVPQVERVVFLSTPHRGSYLAGGLVGRISGSFISLPKKMANTAQDAFTRNLARLSGDKLKALPTAVDNQTPGSAFLEALAPLPIDPRVKANSIVAVQGDGPVEEGDDGVVAYTSAHWPTAESEIVVKSEHSCQGQPRTILEIRRILHAHLATPPSPAKPPPPK
jgi:pimeloyl-ACP methyl ester carboxylesterase